MNSNILREKITQTVILSDRSPMGEKCGGRMIGSEIIRNSPTGAEEALRVTTELQASSDIPLLIPGDLEAGAGFAISALTKLPYLLGLGATNDTELAYKFGLITGKDARSVGMNWAFAPVADLNLNPRNPVTNMRSIGDTPEKALPMLKAVIKGMQDGGIAACIKHFPGDGVDYRDQHLTTTCNSLRCEDYMKYHGRVFAELAQVAYTVMVGHISLPAYQSETIDGLYPPATLSRELMVDLLRGEMDFKGLVVSDALNMGGYLGWHKDRRESDVLCFKNGCDMMLWPNEHFVDDMVEAVENGFVSEKRVDEAYERIMELKQKLNLVPGRYSVALTDEDKIFAKTTAEELYRRSITLECDKNSQLPFGKDVKKVAIVTAGGTENFKVYVARAQELLKSYGIESEVFESIFVGSVKNMDENFDKILYLLFTQPHQPTGPLDFFGKGANVIWSSLCYGREKSVVVSFGSPYVKNQYFERAYTFINAYTPDTPAVEAVIRALLGECEFVGSSPVKL